MVKLVKFHARQKIFRYMLDTDYLNAYNVHRGHMKCGKTAFPADSDRKVVTTYRNTKTTSQEMGIKNSKANST
jgi:hypothetical protein